MEGLKLRLLGANDLIDVFSLWKESGLPFKPKGRDSIGHMTQELAGGSTFLVGAFVGEAMIGVALGTDDGRKGWINRMAVRPAYRRQGVAKALVEYCEQVFRKRRRVLCCCLIEDWNKASMELFEAEGYEKREDILYFRKMLQAEE
jgi:GNAT superfamily N-acetyltransferase